MNIHEHQAKKILKEYGASVSNGVVIHNLKDSMGQLKMNFGHLKMKK